MTMGWAVERDEQNGLETPIERDVQWPDKTICVLYYAEYNQVLLHVLVI